MLDAGFLALRLQVDVAEESGKQVRVFTAAIRNGIINFISLSFRFSLSIWPIHAQRVRAYSL